MNVNDCRITRRAYLAMLLGYLGVQALFVLFASQAYLLRVDDAYYYYGIARHVVNTGRFTFDGIHLTNGFQPLWQFVVIAVTWIGKLAGVQEREVLVKLYLLTCALLNTASAAVIFRLGKRLFRANIAAEWAFVYLALWFPGLTTSLLCGMENSLNWLLLLLLVMALLDGQGRPSMPEFSEKRMLWLVVTSVAYVYTRVDNALILAAIAAYFVFTDRSPRVLARVLSWGALVFAMSIPLFVWQRSAFDTATPISGSVKLWRTAILIQRVGYWHYPLIVLKALVLSCFAIGLAALGMGYYEIIKPTVLGLGFQVTIAMLGVIVGSIAILSLVNDRRSLRSRITIPLPPVTGLLVTVSAFHLILNAALFPAQWRYAGLIWYFLVEYLLVFVCAGWLISTVTRGDPSHRPRRHKYGVLLLYFAGVLPMFLWRPAVPTEQQLKYLGAQWINDNLPKNSIVAACNAGVTGYFSNVPVINVDGLVNDVVFFEEYLKKKRIRDYLRESKVTHLADHECPDATPGWFWNWVYIPDEGEIRFCLTGNEKGLNFCVVEVTGLKVEP
jgi:hypothetical protein